MDNHKWAFYIWEFAIEKSLIKSNSTLFHVDAHLDDCPFGLQDNPEYLNIEGLSSLYEFTEKYVKYDTFIWPAFGRGTINNIVYVSDFQNEPFQDWATNYVKGRIYEGLRVRSINELRSKVGKIELDQLIKDDTLILNLDLDYFNEGNSYGEKSKLKTDKEITESMTYLKNLYNWDLTTVALSPECCGSEEACDHLLQIFMDVFELDNSKSLSWDK